METKRDYTIYLQGIFRKMVKQDADECLPALVEIRSFPVSSTSTSRLILTGNSNFDGHGILALNITACDDTLGEEMLFPPDVDGFDKGWVSCTGLLVLKSSAIYLSLDVSELEVGRAELDHVKKQSVTKRNNLNIIKGYFFSRNE